MLPRFPAILLMLLACARLQAVQPERPAERVLEGRWLIKVAEGENPRHAAEAAGAKYLGPLKGVEHYHRVRFTGSAGGKAFTPGQRAEHARKLGNRPELMAFKEEQLLVRYPRVFVPKDPLFPKQWHLENIGQAGGVPFADARVRPAWDMGLSGDGVVVAIVDEGIEYRHPDLLGNWLSGSGYDFNGRDTDPSPGDDLDRHGTAVAGITLAASNTTGVVGIAHNSRMVPIRLIAGPVEQGQEAEALSLNRQVVDIYNNSWGPSDNFIAYAPISDVLGDALLDNVTNGRGGLGNIYVWAAGNGGLNGDNSNYDGYNASPYTISVGAVGDDDIKAGYSEPGANLLVVAPSQGTGSGILTTDNTGSSGYGPGDVYENFNGTSAAAPVVSGVVALMLEQRPDLGWMDVQQILARTAVPVDFSPDKWQRNGAGLWVSHDYGFGRVDAHAAVQLSRDWQVLGPLERANGIEFKGLGLAEGIPANGSIYLNSDMRVQFVRVTISCNHSDWGDLRVELVSPAGTRSVLAESHADVNSPFEPGEWTYLSTRHLGESARGRWRLEVTDESTGGTGRWTDWAIELMGHVPETGANSSPLAEDLNIQGTVYPVEVDALDGLQDPDGDPLEILSVQYPASGTLQTVTEGRFLYTIGDTPDGTDTFSLLVGDGKGGVKRRLVRMLDPRPVARNDLFPVLAGTSGSLPVLANDLDPDSDPLRLLSVMENSPVDATIGGTGQIDFTAPPGWNGVSRLQYRLTDDSDGESTGWATLVTQSVADIALDFDGEDDFVRLPATGSVNLMDKFTVEAWIYPKDWGEAVTGFGRIFDRDYFVFFLTGFDHAFYNDQSLVAFMVLNDGASVAVNSPANSLQLNKWQHVALSFDSSNPFAPVRMYVNGQPASVTYPLERTPPLPAISDNRNRDLFIGESESGARAFNGRMTEFRIWDSVLDPAAISLRHDRRLDGSEPDLQFYLPLDRTLEPIAVSIGSFNGMADISGAQRIPRQLPWEELESHYSLILDSGSGWWQERSLGWLFGDAYPWVYLPSMGWAYTGHSASSNVYLLYRATTNWGWLQTAPSYYPWLYQIAGDRWLWHLEGTSNPAWFYDSASSRWITGGDDVPTP